MKRQSRNWSKSRFDNQEEEPLGPLANLVDIMLVFACGLIAALTTTNGNLATNQSPQGVQIEKGNELPEVPNGLGESGSGFEAVGQVYRDPKTGALILLGESTNTPR